MPKNTSPKEPLTEQQHQVLNYIKDTCATRGAPPSYREIQAHFGYKAVGSVQGYVRALIRKGYLDNPQDVFEKRRSRVLFPAGFRPQGAIRVPIYGEIAAGSPRETPQVELGFLLVSQETSRRPSFALRVVGDSMIEAGILEGDYVIVEKDARIKNGDIVVALVGGETTVKRFRQNGQGVFLVPENRRMKPIKIVDKGLVIQGKVVGLQRNF